VTADQEWHAQIGDWCESRHPAEKCPNCGAENNGELHLPEYTLLCWVCETRFKVVNPLGRV
jgi:hypothetical protein